MRVRDKIKFEKRRENLYEAMRKVGDKFDMGSWLDCDSSRKARRTLDMKMFEECGSAACICGTGFIAMPVASRPRITETRNIAHHSDEIMAYYSIALDVVATYSWPLDLRNTYHLASDYKERIDTAIKACEHFVME